MVSFVVFGWEIIQRLIEKVEGRIEIFLVVGICLENVVEFVVVVGCDQVYVSFFGIENFLQVFEIVICYECQFGFVDLEMKDEFYECCFVLVNLDCLCKVLVKFLDGQ